MPFLVFFSGRDFVAHFPTTFHLNGLSYHPLPLINVFSVSVWFKTNIVASSSLQTIFSIVAKGQPKVDAFVIDLRDKRMRIESTGNNRYISSGELRDGNWHHVAFTWSAVNGAWKLYLNATLLGHGSGFSTGFSIDSGYLVVGHEQDSYGGDFGRDEGFQGSMAELTRWQNTLDIHTKATLERIYNVLLFPDGGWMVDQSVVKYFAVARTDIPPNWYIAAPSLKPQIINNTAGGALDFVGDFKTPRQYKRCTVDKYHPYSPEERYDKVDIEDLGEAPLLLVPSPVSITGPCGTSRVVLNESEWRIVYDEPLTEEAEYLAGEHP
ncbi:predicted protein [Nematostella vectensis]|uniref:N-acetyl-beta-glucosaminidase n=1 Tax=Nematostella vectensis TaxID=45351 RepID=A7RQ55_NEMVE|nr:predicted protein [Nematostella vectensis]|eukprot:XP_001638566.1 predicted protein [Nematostella vectensis]